MSDHLKVKQKLKSITLKADFDNLLDSLVLTKLERRMMEAVYYERLTFAEIAQEFKYSEVGVRRMHQKVLEKLKPILLCDE